MRSTKRRKVECRLELFRRGQFEFIDGQLAVRDEEKERRCLTLNSLLLSRWWFNG